MAIYLVRIVKSFFRQLQNNVVLALALSLKVSVEIKGTLNGMRIRKRPPFRPFPFQLCPSWNEHHIVLDTSNFHFKKTDLYTELIEIILFCIY